jgi:hypothetical protein
MDGQGQPSLGCVRISGELRKLGIRVDATTIRTLLRRHGPGPPPRRSGPTWARFLKAQAEGIVACDLLHSGDDPAAEVASDPRCKRATGVGSLGSYQLTKEDPRPWPHEYRPLRPSAPRSTSCSPTAASC